MLAGAGEATSGHGSICFKVQGRSLRVKVSPAGRSETSPSVPGPFPGPGRGVAAGSGTSTSAESRPARERLGSVTREDDQAGAGAGARARGRGRQVRSRRQAGSRDPGRPGRDGDPEEGRADQRPGSRRVWRGEVGARSCGAARRGILGSGPPLSVSPKKRNREICSWPRAKKTPPSWFGP